MFKFLIAPILLFCFTLNADAQFSTLKPLGQNTGGYLGDVKAHVIPSELQTYLDPDNITSCHECSHAIHSRIRREMKVPYGYYLMNDDIFTLPSNPTITLSDVASSVPAQFRGSSLYNLYLVQSRQWWQAESLYILDEQIAYTNGALTGLQLNNEQRATDSYKSALTLYFYAQHAQELCRKSGYKDQKLLDEFMEFIKEKRLKYIAREFRKKNWLTAEHTAWLARIGLKDLGEDVKDGVQNTLKGGKKILRKGKNVIGGLLD